MPLLVRAQMGAGGKDKPCQEMTFCPVYKCLPYLLSGLKVRLDCQKHFFQPWHAKAGCYTATDSRGTGHVCMTSQERTAEIG